MESLPPKLIGESATPAALRLLGEPVAVAVACSRPVHTTSANPPLLQSSLRKEPEVGTACVHVRRGLVLIPTSFNVTPEELFDLFGKFGPVRYVAFSACQAFCRARHANLSPAKSARASPTTPRAPHSLSMKT